MTVISSYLNDLLSYLVIDFYEVDPWFYPVWYYNSACAFKDSAPYGVHSLRAYHITGSIFVVIIIITRYAWIP